MLWIDTETYSETPIKYGTYVYVSTCEPMIVTWAVDDGPIECWDRTQNPTMPEALRVELANPEQLGTAQNAMFDRNVIKYGLGVDVPITRWRCNMVRALAHALPGGLDALCEILDVEQDLRKQKAGKKLIHLFCKPIPFKHSLPKGWGTPKTRKAEIERLQAAWTGRATHATHPVEWAEFLDYAKADIAAMRALDSKIPKWNYEPGAAVGDSAAVQELALYHLDQVINDRGMYVDTDLAHAAVRAVERAKADLKSRTVVITNTEVESTTKRDQLLAHILREYGIDLPDMQMSTLERRIQDPNLPPELRELLGIRLQASSTSTSKYQALLRGVMPDNRLRGTLQFNGASRTRRHAGRTFQPQNLPSKGMPDPDVVDFGIEAMKGDYEDMVLPDVMAAASFAIRGCITAPPGKKLVISDLRNIEGRDGAWLAGEDWKLQAFREFDAGTGPDLYKLAYANSFKVPIDSVTDKQRQVGKVEELMLQYQGGVGAFATGAATYGIDLEALAASTLDSIAIDVVREATKFLEWVRDKKMPTFGMSDEAFVTCDSLKRMWRASQPAISTLWPELQSAVIEAINTPGNTFECRKFKVRRDGGWLRIQLPSGRALCYPSPQFKDGSITYMGNNQYTRQWTRLHAYGGKFFENACQSLAGDIMKSNMPRIEAAGYEIVLTVHDEVVTETPDSPEFNAKHLSELLATTPPWAEGMPLAAAGFETYRYRKG